MFRSLIRSIQRSKWYYLIHLTGVTLGLTAAGLTILFVQHELQYDRIHEDSHRIHRVSYQNNSGWFAPLARPYSDAIASGGLPEVEETVRIRRWPAKYLFVGDQKFYEAKVMLTDPGSAFFSTFDFALTEGNRETALERPRSVAISRSLAKKYFGESSALGEAVKYDTMELTVTAVFEDFPSNSSFDFSMLITDERAMNQASGHYVFVKLANTADPVAVETKIGRLPVSTSDFQKPSAFKLIALPDIHFDANMTYELRAPGDKGYLWALVGVGVLITLISLTNFVSFSIALSAYRSREIAVRKSVGASINRLSRQFFGESVVLAIVALVCAIGLLYLVGPWFDGLMQVTILSPHQSVTCLLVLVVMALAFGVLGATYPTLVLPRIRIVDLFKGRVTSNIGALALRHGLLSFQFAVLFFVCSSLWIVDRQMNFMQEKDLGFTPEGIVKISRSWGVDSLRYWKLKKILTENPDILHVSEGFAPGDEDYGYTFRSDSSEVIEEGVLVHSSDYDYLQVLDIKPIAGDVCTVPVHDLPARSCLINRTMAKRLGYTNPVGRQFVLNAGKQNERKVTIDGVIDDFHFTSLHHDVSPHVLFLNQKSKYVDENILVKVRIAEMTTVIDYINAKMAEVAPEVPISIGFVSESLQRLYEREIRLAKVFQVLVVVAIILSLAGLVALCSYTIARRTREMAIRKIFGADSMGIVNLFARSFLVTMIGGFLVGASISWVAMEDWLSRFAFRTSIEPQAFVVILVATAVSVLAVVLQQSLRTLRMNPAQVLKED